MPTIIFEGPRMETEMKRELVRGIVETVNRITGHPKEIIMTLIHENPPENVGPGGELLVDKKVRSQGEKK